MNRNIASLRIACSIAIAAIMADVFFVCWSPSFGIFILLLCVAPIVSLIFIALAIWAGRRTLIGLGSILLACLAATYVIGHSGDLLRSETRWWSARGTWKQRVLAQQEVPGQLKHLDWDGWGFAAQDTEVYLVYDPSDGLRNAIGTPTGKHGVGLPCDVWKVWRLEPHWYNVVFYTNTSWDSCS
jgi:hypothetical protein